MNLLEKNRPVKIIENIIIPIVLLLYPLLKTRFGVDYIDSMYSPGNFVFFASMEGTWVVATFLSNAIGHLITLLPGAATYLGLHIYTNLLISVISLTAYFWLKKRVPFYVAGLGEVIAIGLCWCPSTILYNYLTYFFMMLGLIWLYLGLTEEKKYYLIFAGMALGLNLFVRFPNAAEVGFILAVWVYDILKKKKLLQVIQDTLWCMLGYFVSILICMGIIISLYGPESYISMISALFGMTGDNTSYQPIQMVMAIIRELRLGLKWPVILLGPAILCGFVSTKTNKSFAKVFRIISFILIPLLYGACYKMGMINFDYNSYSSFMGISVAFVIVGIIVCIIIIFYKNEKLEYKLVSGVGLLCIGITPLGSNNDLFPIYNNLFLLAPVILFLAGHLFKRIKESNKMDILSVEVSIGCLTLVLLVQSIGFGTTFSFRGHRYGTQRDVAITQNAILYGMVTNKEKADAIEELTLFWNENKTEKVLLIGNIPGVSYFLQVPCAITTSWPDLGSYSYEEYARQLDGLQKRIDNNEEQLPTIIMNYGAYSVIENNTAAKEKYSENQDEGEGYLDIMERDPKLADMRSFISKYNYKMQLCNQRFVVYTPY